MLSKKHVPHNHVHKNRRQKTEDRQTDRQTDLLSVLFSLNWIHSRARLGLHGDLKLGILAEATGVAQEGILFIIVDCPGRTEGRKEGRRGGGKGGGMEGRREEGKKGRREGGKREGGKERKEGGNQSTTLENSSCSVHQDINTITTDNRSLLQTVILIVTNATTLVNPFISLHAPVPLITSLFSFSFCSSLLPYPPPSLPDLFLSSFPLTTRSHLHL